jgi:tetratricopeptide (TPR) repeat protein
MDPSNHASLFNLAKIHFLNGNYQAVEESISIIIANPRYKDCYEAIRLLAKVKQLQDNKYESLALYRRMLELNPRDYKACYDVG